MAKWYGEIGYAQTVEVSPGVWEEQITSRYYYGDVVKNTRQLQGTDQVVNNVNISNEFSIVSDTYASENFLAMRYVTFMGVKWKVSTVEVQYPRLILTTGGVYNG